jgi:hypothetical protein
LQIAIYRYQRRRVCAHGAPVDNFAAMQQKGAKAVPRPPTIGVRFAHDSSIGWGAVAPSQTLPKDPLPATATGTDSDLNFDLLKVKRRLPGRGLHLPGGVPVAPSQTYPIRSRPLATPGTDRCTATKSQKTVYRGKCDESSDPK